MFIFPLFDLASYPQSERIHLSAIQEHLEALNTYVEEFGYALALFDQCDVRQTQSEVPPSQAADMSSEELTTRSNEIRTLGRWQIIAAHAAIVAASNCQESMKHLTTHVNNCEALYSEVDAEELKAAKATFNGDFPGIRAFRRRVAHTIKPGQHDAATGSYMSSGVRITDSKHFSLKGELDNRRYTATINGQVVKCEISQKSLDALRKAKDRFFTAFNVAERVAAARRRR